MARNITNLKIEMSWEEDGNKRSSAVGYIPLTPEVVEVAKRHCCRRLDAMLDERSPAERLAALDRTITGTHAVQNIIREGNSG